MIATFCYDIKNLINFYTISFAIIAQKIVTQFSRTNNDAGKIRKIWNKLTSDRYYSITRIKITNFV